MSSSQEEKNKQKTPNGRWLRVDDANDPESFLARYNPRDYDPVAVTVDGSLTSQRTVTSGGEPTEIAVRGRHDPCLLPRFVPMGEAMVALVLVDHWLRFRGQCG